jgi:multicomponent Na+:H+ antiporter subunit F
MSPQTVMHVVFLATAFIVALMVLPYMARAVAGPSVFDRVIGLNALGTKVAVLLVLVGELYDRSDMFVDIALALFLLNLVTTLLIARYVRERRGRTQTP